MKYIIIGLGNYGRVLAEELSALVRGEKRNVSICGRPEND